MYFNSKSLFSSLLWIFGICVRIREPYITNMFNNDYQISEQTIAKTEFTTEDCKELGFEKTRLMCSSCEYLDDFGLEQIK